MCDIPYVRPLGLARPTAGLRSRPRWHRLGRQVARPRHAPAAQSREDCVLCQTTPWSLQLGVSTSVATWRSPVPRLVARTQQYRRRRLRRRSRSVCQRNSEHSVKQQRRRRLPRDNPKPHGRTGSLRKRSTGERSGSAARPAAQVSTATVRSWARKNGYTIADHGRVPAEVAAGSGKRHDNRAASRPRQAPLCIRSRVSHCTTLEWPCRIRPPGHRSRKSAVPWRK